MLDNLSLFTCILFGSTFGSLVTIVVMYGHFKLIFKDYFYNKESFKTRSLVNELHDKVNSLQLQISSINAELYKIHVKSEDNASS